MRTQEFLADVRDQAIARLPGPLQGLRTRILYSMLKLHYGEPRVHYEVWLVTKTDRIEIGLHFEADRETNHAWAATLAERVLELREALGPEAELEEWSPSWTRLHLTLPLGALNEDLSGAVSDRLAALIEATAPMLSGLEARPRESGGRDHTGRGHWRHRPRRSLAG